MPSWTSAEQASRLDEALFFLASGGALTTAVFTAGAAAGLTDLGTTGAVLSLLGTAVSWRIRRWPRARALSFGGVLGVIAGVFWLLRVLLSLGEVGDNLGLLLALEMTTLLVALSFVLVRAEIAAFALVPGLSVLGLAAGQGDESYARTGFLLFLPLGLLAVGYAMLTTGAVSGGPPRLPEGSARGRGAMPWQVRPWPVLAGLILLILAVAQVLYLPIQRWAEAHRWQVITVMAGSGLPRSFRRERRPERNLFAIGQGPLALSPTPLLVFTGDYAPYWRGSVYDVYLGHAWGNSATRGRIEYPTFPPSGTILVSAAEGRPVSRHRVQVQRPLPPMFYAPGRVVRIVAAEGLSLPPAARVVVDRYGVVRATAGTLGAGSSYEVTSVPLEPQALAPPAEKAVDPRYLALPFETTRVAELARQVAGGAPTPQKKLAALIGYLQQHCLYRLDAPAIPPGQDAVDYFVFQQKVGYCDLFASALAIMGRAVGVPTRVVTGYAFPSPAREGGADSYVLTEADGHAWVEAYLPEAGGWVTMDATPAQERATPAAPPGWEARVQARWEALRRTHPRAAGGLALGVVLLLGLGGYGLRRRLLHRGPRSRRAQEVDWRWELVRTYVRLCLFLRRRGLPRHPAQTPLEYLAFLEEHWDHREGAAALPLVRALTGQFLLARYSPTPVSEEMARAAQEQLTAVRQAAKGKWPGPSPE